MKSWMCTHNQREGIIVLVSYYFVIHKFQTLQYPLFYCVYRCTFVLPFQYFDTENNSSAVLTFCSTLKSTKLVTNWHWITFLSVCHLYATFLINQKTSISTTTTVNVKVNKIINELKSNHISVSLLPLCNTFDQPKDLTGYKSQWGTLGKSNTPASLYSSFLFDSSYHSTFQIKFLNTVR